MSEFGAELKQLMNGAGIGVRPLAREVPCSAAYISQLLSGERFPSAKMARRIDEVLGAGGSLAALAPASGGRRHRESESPAPKADIPALAWMVGRMDQRVDRRTAARFAEALAEAPSVGMADPAERLAHALTRPAALTEAAVAYLETRSVGYHLLESVLPSGGLLRPVLAHLNEIITLLEGCADLRMHRRLAGTAGETALLGAWLEWDCGDFARAGTLYRAAAMAAAESGDQAISACAVIYQSLGAVSPAARARERGRLAAARKLTNSTDQATRAWLFAREAEEAAALGDRSAAATMREAEEAFAGASPAAERSWTRCLETPQMVHSQLTVATRLGDEEWAYRAISKLAVLATDPESKRTGRMLASIGIALARLGDITEARTYGWRSLEAIQVSQARYAFHRLAEFGATLEGDQGSESAELLDAIRSLRQELASPR
jgi:transcriptional regulator with XRE-family HTH domain